MSRLHVNLSKLSKSTASSEDYTNNIENLDDIIDDDGDDLDIGISLSDIIEGEEDKDDFEDQDDAQDPQKTPTASSGKRPKDEFSVSDLLMKLFVYGAILITWGTIVFLLNLPMEQGFLEAQGSEIFISFLTFMAIICYFKCCNTSCINPHEKVPASINSKEKNSCKHCDKWKPDRTHHCSQCGQCILRMDHHCPWICNCVGYRNHKAFLLFCFYVGVGSLYFDYKAFYFFYVSISVNTLYEYPSSFLLFTLLGLFVVLPVGLMAFGLSIYHFMLAMNNLTTLESLGGTDASLPCGLRLWKKTKKTNKYDNGKLANLKEFFGDTYFLWWWPTVPPYTYRGENYSNMLYCKSKGQQFIHQEEIKLEEKEGYFDKIKGVNEAERKRTKPINIKEVNVENFLKLAEEFVKGKEIKFNDAKIQINKSLNDLEELAPPQDAAMQDPYVLSKNSIQNLDIYEDLDTRQGQDREKKSLKDKLDDDEIDNTFI